VSSDQWFCEGFVAKVSVSFLFMGLYRFWIIANHLHEH
jgi:hypothetical protein